MLIERDEIRVLLRSLTLLLFCEISGLNRMPEIMAVKDVPVTGLMAMAGLDSKGQDARLQFAAVRQLRDTIKERFGSVLNQLSMGMSGDFEEAIREGSTMVRIGSRLFEGLA